MILTVGPLGTLWAPVTAHAAAPNTVAVQARPAAAWVKDVVVVTGDTPDLVRVSRDGDAFVVDVSTGLTAGTGCTAASDTVVRCPVAGVVDVRVSTGAGNDTIAVQGRTPTTQSVGSTVLSGGPGHDLLIGGDGSDTFEGGPGDDRLWGNAGNDSFQADSTDDGADDMQGSDGVDSVAYRNRTRGVAVSLDGEENDGTIGAAEGDNVGADIEHVYGGHGADRIVGNELANTLDGGRGDDVLEGHEGDDRIDGGRGNDSIDGGDGDDWIDDGDGRDKAVGGPGNDEFEPTHYAGNRPHPESDSYDGGPGRDTISYNGQRFPFVGVTVDFDGVADDGAEGENDSLTGFENLIGTYQDDVLTGNDERNEILGEGGADRIDSVDGISGNDFVDGGGEGEGADGAPDVCRVDPGDIVKECGT